MIKATILIFVGILSVTVSFNAESIVLVASQSSIENSSNLTYPNNPTLTIGEKFNATNPLENNSGESDNNLPSPM